jgi:TRAP transporter TAXI family solute receptor
MRASLAVLLVAATAAVAWADTLPKAVTIGSNPPGTGYYAVASGLAKVVSQGTPMQMAVQPHSGTSTMLPLLDTGEMEFGTINAVDVGLAYRGPGYKVGGRNPFQHSPNVRVIQRGSPLLVGLLVRKDSPIKSVQDVKGKRMTGEYPAHLAVGCNMFGHLASAGLGWSDVKVVPVPAVNDGIDALVQGRADVSEHALGAAKTKEADSAVGVRHVSIDCSPEGQLRLKKAVPGYYGRIVKAGAATAVVEDTCFLAYDTYLVASKAVGDHVVEAVVKAIWERVDELHPVHPLLKEWTRDRFVDPEPTLPYHPGAIRFYKDKGAWSAAMDQVQQKVLNP